MAEDKPYHHGDLQHALVQAALETIREKGVAALTLRGVGARLGVSRTALYRHFQDKDALLANVALAGFRLLRDALAGTTDLNDMAVAYVDFAIANPSHYRAMFGTAVGEWCDYPELQTAGNEAFGVLVDAIAQGQAARQIQPGDPIRFAQVTWSLVHGIAMLTIDGKLELKGPPGIARFAAESLWNGISVLPS